MTIIEHDFGSEKRRKERLFRRLLDLDALHEDNIRKNPLPYLERASERIFQLESALIDAHQAAMPPREGDPSTEVVTLNREEYERLLRCRDIVREAIVHLCSTVEDKEE